METVNAIRHDKVTINGMLSRRVPLLQILKSVKEVEIVFKKSREEQEKEMTLVVNSKKAVKNRMNGRGDTNDEKRKLRNRKQGKIEKESKMSQEEKVVDDKLGWFFDEETKKVVYCDSFTNEEIWRIRGLEELHKKKHELELCKKYKTKPFSIKVVRLELYKCKYCNLRYKSVVSRRLHERTHLKKDLTCNKCGKEFALKQYKDQHENKHITLKRFRCLLCGKRFSYASGLSRHKRKSHAELPNRMLRLELEKKRKQMAVGTEGGAKTAPYRCEECGRTFTRGIAFANHKRGHNPNKRFKCFYCPQEFKLEYNLKEHIKKLHQDSTDDEDIFVQANEHIFIKKRK